MLLIIDRLVPHFVLASFFRTLFLTPTSAFVLMAWGTIQCYSEVDWLGDVRKSSAIPVDITLFIFIPVIEMKSTDLCFLWNGLQMVGCVVIS